MADQINVLLRDLVTGNEIDAELPAQTRIADLLPEITRNLGLEEAGRHTLRNKSQNYDYEADDTLASRNTQEEDVLGLAYDATFG